MAEVGGRFMNTLQKLSCPACGAKLKLPEVRPGKKVRCPKCQRACYYEVFADPIAASASEPSFTELPSRVMPAGELVVRESTIGRVFRIGLVLTALAVAIVIVAGTLRWVVAKGRPAMPDGRAQGTIPEGPPAGKEEIREEDVDEDAYFPKRHAVTPFVAGRPHGETRSYDRDHRLIVVEPMVNGVVHGDRTCYYPSGKKFGLMHFEKGRVQGIATVWFESGVVALETEFKDGILEGTSTTYYADGTKSDEVTYVAAQRHGEEHQYRKDGRLYSIVTYDHGTKVGSKLLLDVSYADYQEILRRGEFSSVLKHHWTPAKVAAAGRAPSTAGAQTRPKRQEANTGSPAIGALAGWEGLPGVWEVMDGAIVASTYPQGSKENTFLCSKESYRDFELDFDVRLRGKNNSGVMIRSELVDTKKYWLNGIKIDLGTASNTNWGAIVTYNGRNGRTLVRAPGSQMQSVVKADDFNHVAVRCVGQHLTVHINGEKFHEADVPSVAPSGLVGFQLRYGNPTEVALKNIHIRPVE
jgi:Domain of Unknown Function (DUF1080)